MLETDCEIEPMAQDYEKQIKQSAEGERVEIREW